MRRRGQRVDDAAVEDDVRVHHQERLALDDGPLCADCTAAAPPAAVAAWRDARDELRAAQAAGETGASAVWMRALLDCERAAVHAARGCIRTLPADGYTGPLLFGACA